MKFVSAFQLGEQAPGQRLQDFPLTRKNPELKTFERELLGEEA